MMQCLHDSGYNIGDEDDLRGGYFFCEHKKLIRTNEKLLEKYTEQLSRMWLANESPVFDPNDNLGSSLIDYFKARKIQAIKFFGMTLHFWLQFDFFKKAKFIRTVRDKENIIDSAIEKNKREGIKPVARWKYGGYLERYNKYLDILQKYNHIYVEFENMFKQPEIESKRIAEFLGIRSFSTRPINEDSWHHRPHHA